VLWNFSSGIPDVVIINLGTNDFARTNPEEEGWVNAYKEFIARIRKNYPDARIYCAIGTMMSDGWPPEQKALTTIRAYIARVVSDLNGAGDSKVQVIDFGTQKPDNGLGADWHPSVKTHQVMAEQLTAALKKDLGW
jgi:lysophospholipase L1-like esterase